MRPRWGRTWFQHLPWPNFSLLLGLISASYSQPPRPLPHLGRPPLIGWPHPTDSCFCASHWLKLGSEEARMRRRRGRNFPILSLLTAIAHVRFENLIKFLLLKGPFAPQCKRTRKVFSRQSKAKLKAMSSDLCHKLFGKDLDTRSLVIYSTHSCILLRHERM